MTLINNLVYWIDEDIELIKKNMFSWSKIHHGNYTNEEKNRLDYIHRKARIRLKHLKEFKSKIIELTKDDLEKYKEELDEFYGNFELHTDYKDDLEEISDIKC